METVNMHDAKTRLSQLVDKVAKGEPFIIAKAGKPIARVTAIDSPISGNERRLGFLKDQFQIPADFDRMGEDEITTLFGS
ncbi:MAG: type II toxin-antitoxin system prevent-host-death family antitoxin [Alcanivorax sp.]|nr:type II toxin-antitoxin system prevent-host-death family antitoxin [Alcanivorax sp.]